MHDGMILRLRRLALPACALAAVVLFSATAGQPYHLDNMDFPAVAEAAARTGLPVFYRGEFTPALVGLWHPPLYIYTLAAWFRMFGNGEIQARMLGLACAFLLGWIWLEIGRALYGRKLDSAAVWYWPLLLWNPFTLQGASVTDIDTTIYGPLLAGILLVTVRMSWREGEPRPDAPGPLEWAALTALITLSLWAKLTTVWAVLPAACLLASHWGAGKGNLGRACAAVAAAVGLFVCTYALYGYWTGLDVWYSVRFTLESFLERGTKSLGESAGRVAAYWQNLCYMIPFHLRWTGALPWVAAAWAALVLVWRAAAGEARRDRSAAVLLVLALSVTVYYCMHTPSYANAPFKYVYLFWPAAVLCAAAAAGKASEEMAAPGRRWGRAAVTAAAILWLASAAAALIWVGDRLIYWNRMLWPQSLTLWIPAAIAALALASGVRRGAAALMLLAAAMYGGMSTGVASAQAKAFYSTTYDYGQEGLEETACYVRAHTAPDEMLVCMKDLGYYAQRRYWQTYSAIQGVPQYMNGVLGAIASGKVRYAIFTEGRGQDQLSLNPVLKAGVEEMCRIERSIGHYRVYDCRAVKAAAAPVNARLR
jgi:hypothetical protein